MSNTKAEEIQSMFGKIAKQYDFTNGILSFQLHRLWNKKLAKALKGKHTLLDLCAGTGEIGYRWLEQESASKKAIFLDFCEQMLEVAKAKRLPHLVKGHHLEFVRADATQLPFEDNSVDGVSIAYGIRNIQGTSKCLSEVFRVLKPNGKFAILELTEPKNFFLKKAHSFYLTSVLPFLGNLLTKEKGAYSYLASSIQSFIKPEELKNELDLAGFENVTLHPLTFGIATLFEGTKKQA